MKKFFLFGCLFIGTSLFAEEKAVKEQSNESQTQKSSSQAVASDKEASAPRTYTPAEIQKSFEALGYHVGMTATHNAIEDFQMSAKEQEAFRKGLTKGVAAKDRTTQNPEEQKTLLDFLETRSEIVMKQKEQEMAQKATGNKEKAKTFLAELEKKTNVKKTASGLYYEIEKQGSDEKPTKFSTVKVDYVGTLISGEEFDSSKKRGQPATFGLMKVIPGFQEGLQLVGKGGTIKLYIPSDLAYGERDLPGIPGGSLLIFQVDMIDIVKDAS